MDVEGSLSEAGYLVATLEAAVSFIAQVFGVLWHSDDFTTLPTVRRRDSPNSPW